MLSFRLAATVRISFFDKIGHFTFDSLKMVKKQKSVDLGVFFLCIVYSYRLRFKIYLFFSNINDYIQCKIIL